MFNHDPVEHTRDLFPGGETFNEQEVIAEIRRYLPSQNPLKDFIHHNTLHAFQKLKFSDALHLAGRVFGYRVQLPLADYRERYHKGSIRKEIFARIAEEKFGKDASEWKYRLLEAKYSSQTTARVGRLRNEWDKLYDIDLDLQVHPKLFRVLGSFLDQGIAIWNFPVHGLTFLEAVRELERNSFVSIFSTARARKMLLGHSLSLTDLLELVVGKEELYRQYLFDQQFSHPGWSGLVACIEQSPGSLADARKISLHELVYLELLLEIDALDEKYGEVWAPVGIRTTASFPDLFSPIIRTEADVVLQTWQEILEWSYYDEVLGALKNRRNLHPAGPKKSFQAVFCIDDRETSLRDYLEKTDPACETYTTPGFFGIEFYFQPQGARSYTRQCPAPVSPRHLIKEIGIRSRRKRDLHFTRHSHSLLGGWITAQTLGLVSGLRLMFSIFRPTAGAFVASSSTHMHEDSQLTILLNANRPAENGLRIGFTPEEMAGRLEDTLRSIALVNGFAPLVYIIGHGATSANNPHYAAYNCGACSGRPGSVNARVFALMANMPEVRDLLRSRGIDIPSGTVFIGGLHDTTRDEVSFFDTGKLEEKHREQHRQNAATFRTSLQQNSRERARRFELLKKGLSPGKTHEKVKQRALSLFEPRPELNHAANALCIIGRRSLTRGVFLDRRAFTNSYDYRLDKDLRLLHNIMKPIGPVCGGINLEYYFSRVDNRKLGAGTKLPHNVMGLIGVANGVEGDLRPGLPEQMIEVHDPVRLITIVEQDPDKLLETIQGSSDIYEWYINEWIHLVAIHPETAEIFVFRDGRFTPYEPLSAPPPVVHDFIRVIENEHGNQPVFYTE